VNPPAYEFGRVIEWLRQNDHRELAEVVRIAMNPDPPPHEAEAARGALVDRLLYGQRRFTTACV